MYRTASLLRAAARASSTAARAVLLGVMLAACSDLAGPDAAREPAPFYYYEDDRIYLRVVPTTLTAAPEAAGDTARLRAVLVRHGTPPDSLRPLLTDIAGHWLVYLPARTSDRAAEDAARALRLAEGVRFASAAYTPRDALCPLYLVDRLVVQFRPGADDDAIARLNAATGVRGEARDPWGTRSYRFPARLAATPLELSAHYYRHPLVEWAEADRVTSCLRTIPAAARDDYRNAMR